MRVYSLSCFFWLKQDDTEIGYEQSLLQFVKNLGPTAQMVACRKLKRSSTEAFGYQSGTPSHELQTQKYQIPNVSSVQRSSMVPSSSNILRKYSRKNYRNKRDNNPGNTSHEKASAKGTTNVNDVPRSGFTQANTMKTSVEYVGKSVQTSGGGSISLKQDMIGEGIGNSYPSASPPGDGNPKISSIRSTYSNCDISSTINNGKNVQMADGTPFDVRNPVGPNRRSIQTIREEATAFKENVGDQGNVGAYLSTALLGDGKAGKAYLSATSNRNSNHEKFISDAIKKIKNVQVGELNSSNLMEYHGDYRGKSVQGLSQGGCVFTSIMADRGNGSADFSYDLLGSFSTTNSIHGDLDKLISSSISKGKNAQIAEAMDLGYHCRNQIQGVGEVGAAFKEDMADQGIGSSYFYTPLLRDESSIFPATWQTHTNTDGLIVSATNKGKNIQMAEMTSSEPRMKESLFSRDLGLFSSKELPPLPEAMGSSWSRAQSTNGLDPNYLVGVVPQSEAMADRRGTSYGGKLEQAGQAWNWFSPTQLGPQPIMFSSFQDQSRESKVDVAGEAGSPQWGRWGSTTPNRQQAMEVSDMNKSHQKSNQQEDLSVGTGNNHHQQYPLGSNHQQQSPMENKYQQQSPVANKYLQQSPLENFSQQQSPLANNHQHQSPLRNNYQQQSPLVNTYLQQSLLANNRAQQSRMADNYLLLQSPLANNYRQQPSLLANNHCQQQSPLANNKHQLQQSPLANNNRQQQQSTSANNNCQQQCLLSTNYHQQQSPLTNNNLQQQQPPLANNNLQQPSLLSNTYHQQSPSGNNYVVQSLFGTNYQQNNYEQQSPLANNYLQQQSPLADNFRQWQSLWGNNYLQQSPLANNNGKQQSPLANNFRQQQSLLGNNYHQQSPLANYYVQQQSTVANNYRPQQSPLAKSHQQQSRADSNMSLWRLGL